MAEETKKELKIPGMPEVTAMVQKIFARFYEMIGVYLPLETVTVQEGDTLWHLAETNLSDGQRWREIFFMNLDTITFEQAKKGATLSPTTIYPGTTLRLLGI